MFYSGNDKQRRKDVALIARQDVAQVISGYGAKSDGIIAIRYNHHSNHQSSDHSSLCAIYRC